MNSLKIPDNGLTLKGSAGDVGPLPPQAFAISLNDSVIEGMIKCVQDGGDIQLALGAKPVSLRISTSTLAVYGCCALGGGLPSCRLPSTSQLHLTPPCGGSGKRHRRRTALASHRGTK